MSDITKRHRPIYRCSVYTTACWSQIG